MTTEGNIIMRLGNQVIKNVEEIIGYNIKLKMGNQTDEINRRVEQTLKKTKIFQ